jgi:hypothetical protein
MTQQYMGQNNITISMPDGGSVPIVSQTEIDPMKTALSPHARVLRHRREAAGPGRLVLARLGREQLILHAVAGCFGRNR